MKLKLIAYPKSFSSSVNVQFSNDPYHHCRSENLVFIMKKQQCCEYFMLIAQYTCSS